MPGRPCSICTSPRRGEIDLDLIHNVATTACAKKYGGVQSTYARHKRLHLRPQLQAVAQVAMPALHPIAPANIVGVIPTVSELLAKFGSTIGKLERLVDDAEKDGGIAVRAVSLRELRTGLTDATKIIATLAPPPAPPVEQIDHRALRNALHSVTSDDREELLDRLVP